MAHSWSARGVTCIWKMSKIICVNKIDLKCGVRFCTHAFTQFIFTAVCVCGYFFCYSVSGCVGSHYVRNTIIQFTDFQLKDWFLFIYFPFYRYFHNQFFFFTPLTPKDYEIRHSSMTIRWIKTIEGEIK